MWQICWLVTFTIAEQSGLSSFTTSSHASQHKHLDLFRGKMACEELLGSASLTQSATVRSQVEVCADDIFSYALPCPAGAVKYYQ